MAHFILHQATVPIENWKNLCVRLYGAEKTGLSLQASNERLRNLKPALPLSNTQNRIIPQKSNIVLPLNRFTHFLKA